MIAKGGYKLLIPTFLVACIFLSISLFTGGNIWIVLFWIVFLFFLFSVYFLRDPERRITPHEKLVLAPADGRVVEIAKIEDEFIGQARRISIFMSLFDVHVNRSPVAARIVRSQYDKGRFLAAMRSEASVENERRTLWLQNDILKLKVIQIAGLIARRIVTYCKTGDQLSMGERFGMIVYGSRVDVILPKTIRLNVKNGDRLFAGVSILGVSE